MEERSRKKKWMRWREGERKRSSRREAWWRMRRRGQEKVGKEEE